MSGNTSETRCKWCQQKESAHSAGMCPVAIHMMFEPVAEPTPPEGEAVTEQASFRHNHSAGSDYCPACPAAPVVSTAAPEPPIEKKEENMQIIGTQIVVESGSTNSAAIMELQFIAGKPCEHDHGFEYLISPVEEASQFCMVQCPDCRETYSVYHHGQQESVKVFRHGKQI